VTGLALDQGPEDERSTKTDVAVHRIVRPSQIKSWTQGWRPPRNVSEGLLRYAALIPGAHMSLTV
jgi:hypothetical protein